MRDFAGLLFALIFLSQIFPRDEKPREYRDHDSIVYLGVFTYWLLILSAVAGGLYGIYFVFSHLTWVS